MFLSNLIYVILPWLGVAPDLQKSLPILTLLWKWMSCYWTKVSPVTFSHPLVPLSVLPISHGRYEFNSKCFIFQNQINPLFSILLYKLQPSLSQELSWDLKLDHGIQAFLLVKRHLWRFQMFKVLLLCDCWLNNVYPQWPHICKQQFWQLSHCCLFAACHIKVPDTTSHEKGWFRRLEQTCQGTSF